MSDPELISISIVSHAQGHLVKNLLADLRTLTGVRFEIIITLNIPEDVQFLVPFRDLPIRVISNAERKGFGANHNAAFAQSRGNVFIVVNPDIRAQNFTFRPLLETLDTPLVGACAPLVMSSKGSTEDSARRFPTLMRLLSRVILGRREPEYCPLFDPVVVDWVAGMFMAFKREVFARVGGFNERFFMYMEDVDVCRRLKQLGLAVVLDPRCSVVHDAQRASHFRADHMRWHLRSAVRFFTGF